MGFSLNNLVKRIGADINPFDGPKQAPRPASTAQPHQNPLQHALGNVSHAVGNTVNAGAKAASTGFGVGENLAKGLAQTPVYFAKADIINPARAVAAQLSGNKLAQQHAFQAQSSTLGKTPGQALERLGGNTANLALTAVAPGVSKAIEGATTKLVPAIAPKVVQTLAPKVVSNATLGGGFGMAGGAANGENFGQVLKSGVQGAVLGGALPIAGAAIKPLATAGAKAVENRVPLAVAQEGGRNIPKGGKPTVSVPTTKLVVPKPSEAASVSQPLAKVVDGSLSKNTPKVAQNSLTAKAGAQNLSPEVQAQLSGEHNVRNTTNLADTSAKVVDKLPVNSAIEKSHNLLAQPLGHVTDEQTGFIAKSIEKADTAATKARTAGNVVEADRLTREAAALHDGLSEHATARGQANQALIMLYNQSPQGMLYRGLKDLGRAGVKDTPELRAKLQPLSDAIKTAPDAASKADAVASFHQAVSKEMPQNISNKLIGIWKAGLLSGVKTQQGNAISNATFGTLKKISDIPATAVDKGLSLITGKRTKTLTNKGIGQGTAEGLKNAKYTLKTGIDRRNATDKYENHAEIDFKNPIINKTIGNAVKGIFRGMNAADQPFWYPAFKNSMYDQAKADGLTKGLKGQELVDHMNNLVKEPTPQMAETALKEAQKSTLNYDTIGSKAVQGMHKAIDNFGGATPAGKSVAHGVLNVLAPFVRVPTAFLSRTVDFTPLGVGKEIFHQVASGKFDQRNLSQAIGEGLTGTGAIALGIALTQHNLLSGDYPKNDVKEQQRWKAEGITPNSVKIGGKWVSLNYIGPVGLLFNAGNKLENAKDQGQVTQVGSALGGLGQGLMGQSFLQGFTGFSDAIQDPNRNLKTFVNSQASSIVPSIVNDAANATDNYQRQANNVTDSIKNRIPGARESLPTKQDVYGNPLKQPDGKLGTLLGFKPSNSLTSSNPVISEVNRLHGVNPSDSALQVTPTPVGKSITVEKQNVPLNDKQRYALQKQIGQATQKAWGDLIKTPDYKAMDDTQKAAALGNIKALTTESATRQYVVNNNLGTYTKPISTKAYQLQQGGDIAKLASSKLTGGVSSTDTASYYKSPDAEYKALLSKSKTATYNSPATKITADKALAKAKVGSTFDKAVRDAYGLSNADLASYVSSDPNGKAIADKVLAYGDALVNAGIEKKNTFRDKYGNVTIGKTTSSGTSTGTSKFATALKASNTAAKTNQDALLKLVKGAKVTSKNAPSKTLQITKATLKKQTAKRQKATVA